jgi:hypothetical protein
VTEPPVPAVPEVEPTVEIVFEIEPRKARAEPPREIPPLNTRDPPRPAYGPPPPPPHEVEPC